MKRILAFLLAVLTVCSFAACAAQKPADDTQTPVDSQPVEDAVQPDGTEEDASEETQEPEAEPAEPVAIESAKALLETVWSIYQEDEKFPAAGGDYSEENRVDGAPGMVGLENASDLEYLLSFPAAGVEKVDDAASLIHMMNTNTFTCGAFHLANAEDMDTLAAEVKEYVMGKQWMCGFPDKLVVISVGDYLVEVFGLQEQVDTFCTKLAESFPEATVISEDPIA